MICDTRQHIDIRKHKDLATWLHKVELEELRVTTTQCRPFGGVRYWFLCPACHRRCAILYATKELQCRICAKGRYLSELRSPHDRKLLAATRLRRKLGQTEGGIVAPFPPKPKWMRWHTYLILRAKAVRAEQEIWRRTCNRGF